MSIYKEMQEDLKELISLVRLDEQFAAVFVLGVLHLDHQSRLNHQRRINRIEELCRKYGIVQ